MSVREFRPILAAVVSCLLFVSAAPGQTIWYVDTAACPGPGSGTQDDPFCKIQDAINAAAAHAVPPDEIIVADGVYIGAGNKDLDFGGKIIKLRSASGDPATCIIDCEGSGRGFYFHTSETTEALVQGVTIRNGHAPDGGALYFSASSPTLADCAISGNTATRTSGVAYGGGIYCSNHASPALMNCTIVDNTALAVSSYACGGGIFCSESGSCPTLTNCTISGNRAHSRSAPANGGGMYCSGSGASPTLTNCTISGNTVSSSSSSTSLSGGGLCCKSSSRPVVTDCIITRNTAGEGTGPGLGAGVYSSSSAPILTNCTINENTISSSSASPFGAGIHCESLSAGFSPTLTNCIISGNSVYSSSSSAAAGGGVSSLGPNSTPTLINCIISHNTVYSSSGSARGGGVHCQSSTVGATLTNCVINGNRLSSPYSSTYGDGVYCSSSNPVLTNCTLSNNGTTGSTSSNSGGIYCSTSNPTLTNCILWADAPREIRVASGTPLVTYSDVQGGFAGTGNIDVDPGFAFSDDFHLMPGSPCIDTGTNSPTGGLSTTDADGNPRLVDGNGDGQAIVDMGAYESNSSLPVLAVSPSIIEVATYPGDSNPAPRSLSIRNIGPDTLTWLVVTDCGWARVDPPSGSCQQQIDTPTVSFDTAGMAEGDHLCSLTISAAVATNSPRFVLVRLHVLSPQHVPQDYPTIQAAIDAAGESEWVVVADGVYTGSGNRNLDFHGKDITLRSASGNPATCIIDCELGGRGFYFHNGETTQAIVDGFTIRNGNVTGFGAGGPNGGGVCFTSASATLRNCIIENNMVPGGMVGSGGPPPGLGGGLYCYAASPTLVNCIVKGNIGFGPISVGGGVCCDANSDLTLMHCTIEGNTIASEGGGIDCYDSNITLTGCAIRGNTVSGSDLSGGGGLALLSTTASLTNCVISGNTTAGYPGGGGVYCSSASPMLTNCTISGNIASTGGGGVHSEYASPILNNCILWGNTPAQIYRTSGNPAVSYCDVQGGYTGTGNINADPLFLDTSKGDYHLAANSPCIDTGDPASDFSLEPEPDGGRIDMGAYGNTPEATSKGWLYIEGYGQVSRTRVGRTLYDYQLNVRLRNASATTATDVVAELLDVPDNVTIIDGQVNIGTVAPGATVTSTDTFTIRVDRSTPVSALPISWRLTYSSGGRADERVFVGTLTPDGKEPRPVPAEAVLQPPDPAAVSTPDAASKGGSPTRARSPAF
jgi:parallel beta-helix repeat protein